jgi:hypothetical protein
MAFLNDEVFDQGLDWVVANGTRLEICSQEPATYAEATSTYTLGNATVSTGVTQDNSTNGRKVVVPAVSGMSVTGTETATHWALSNGSNTLVAAGSLSASQSVTSGNTIDTAAFDIIIEDAVSA